MTPTDPVCYTGAGLRLAAVDTDGTLLDDDENSPSGVDELFSQMDARGVTFAPASGRQMWTLIDMFPGRPGMIVIGENGGIVMRDGIEVSSHLVDTPIVREVIRLVREATLGPDGTDGGLVMYGKQFAYVERTSNRSVDGVLSCYHRTKHVDDQIAIVNTIEAGEIDDAVVKLAVSVLGPVEVSAEATPASLADTHQYATPGANWVDLQIRDVDRGSAVHDPQRFLGVDRPQAAVFGDTGNDLSMMSEGDLSLAMANAPQDVVETVRLIALSNNEAGVA